MSKIFNSLAAMVLVSWGIGLFFYNLGPVIHILLAMSVSLLVLKVILEK